MGLSAGTKLGPYEIVAPLGTGGMGEVWRARDTRLGRDVAVKVIRSRFAADADQLRRFEKEERARGELPKYLEAPLDDFIKLLNEKGAKT